MTASNMHRSLLALATVAGMLSASPAAGAQWQDNAIGYRWGATFREPGLVGADGEAKDVAKSVFSFTHVDGYKYGGNFLNIDFLVSSKADPAVGRAEGAAEVYVTYRTDLSLNKVTDGKTFAFGPVRDVSLEAGIDLNTKNTAFASHKVMPVVGGVFALDVPGFLNVGFLAAREFNNNGIVGKHVEFDTTGVLATSWGIPIGPVTFAGFGNVVLPKGKDGFGNQTKTEVLVRPKLMLDVGSLWGWKKAIEVGGGFQYWLNKFGNDHSKTKGAEEKTPFVEAALHL